MTCIYKIISPTNRIYVGQTRNVDTRFNRDYNNLRCKGQRKLYNSLKKYSPEAHKFEVEQELPEDITKIELDNYEALYWRKYKDLGFRMMNLKEPGVEGKYSLESKKRISKSKQKLITQFSLDGKLIEIHKSIKSAAEKLKISSGCISANLRGVTKKAANSIFKYGKYENDIKVYIQPHKKRVYVSRTGVKLYIPICQFDLQGNFIKEWKSQTFAAEQLNLNRRCISASNNGVIKSHGGFIWSKNKDLEKTEINLINSNICHIFATEEMKHLYEINNFAKFLNKNKGYIKKGNLWLSNRFQISLEEVKKTKLLVKNIQRSSILMIN